jgi:hypothetical protein
MSVGGGFRLFTRLRKNRARESVEHARRAVARHVTALAARAASRSAREKNARRSFSARISQNFFSREFLRESAVARILLARLAGAARGHEKNLHVEKTPVFAGDFAFFKIPRAARLGPVRGAAHRKARGARRGAARAIPRFYRRKRKN